MADILIYGAINSMAGDNKAAYASQVYDEEQEEFQGEINKKVVNDCAKINGYYETMGVGTATNLKGQTVTDNEFIYRKSGGSQEVATGGAYIESIKGNTLAWNFPVKNANFNGTTNWDALYGTISANNSILTYTVESVYTGPCISQVNYPDIANHKYLFVVSLNYSEKPTSSENLFWGIGGYYGVNNIRANSIVANTWFALSGIVSSTGLATNKELRLYLRTTGMSVGSTIQIKQPIAIDLTLIYGTGNEPSNPAQFEADYQRWFGKPLTYEPYDAGSLRNVQMQGLKTTGFNQWDEEWTAGGRKSGNGDIDTSYAGTWITNTNLIKCLPNQDYYIGNSVDGRSVYIFYYDRNGSFISRNAALFNLHNGVFTTPSNCGYLAFSYKQATLDSNISINISNQTKNGTYEPYEEHNVSVPATTLTGKVNGQGESVVIFPDGMKGVGDIKDEIKVENGVTKAIKRVGRVDLGSSDWTISTTKTYNSFFNNANLPNCKNPSTTTTIGNCLCPKYVIAAQSTWGTKDKELALRTAYGLIITDSSYTDAATFKTAMSGVYLDYELAEPVEYVVDDFGLPLNYLVNANGTEEVTMPESVTSYTAPTISIRYGMNAVGTLSGLPKAYISEESMDAFLSALGVQMGGTWTKTWNAATNKYSFTFTPSSSSS